MLTEISRTTGKVIKEDYLTRLFVYELCQLLPFILKKEGLKETRTGEIVSILSGDVMVPITICVYFDQGTY